MFSEQQKSQFDALRLITDSEMYGGNSANVFLGLDHVTMILFCCWKTVSANIYHRKTTIRPKSALELQYIRSERGVGNIY